MDRIQRGEARESPGGLDVWHPEEYPELQEKIVAGTRGLHQRERTHDHYEQEVPLLHYQNEDSLYGKSRYTSLSYINEWLLPTNGIHPCDSGDDSIH